MTSVIEFTSASITDRGLSEGRPQNEDSLIELPQHGLFAVADGVGGAQAGEVASQMAVEILGEAFINMGDADPEDTMRIALDRANAAIFQMSRDLPQLSSMATTVVALHVAGDIATIAHVGDSRIYRVDPNGRLFRETDDHSVVEEEVRAGRMTPEQALNHPSRNVISRALGAEDIVDPDIKCVLIHPATTFLLCSDGITRHIDDSEIETLLNSEFGPEDICSRMKEICFGRGAEDNLTAVIVRFPGERLSIVKPDDDEIEEVTLAGVREPLEVEADQNVEIQANDSARTTDPDILDLGNEVIDEAPKTAVEKHDDEESLLEHPQPVYSDTAPVPVAEAPVEVQSTREFSADPLLAGSVSSYGYESESTAGNSFGRFFSVIGLLIMGAVLGALIGYFLMKAYQTPVVIPAEPAQKSDDISLVAFEESRRQIDENPAAYLDKPAQPRVAEDYFLLGRASLLTGKTLDARNFFVLAKEQLSTADPKNVKVLTNEIAMALAIIDDEQARDAFAKQIAAGTIGTGGEANANSTANGAVPRR